MTGIGIITLLSQLRGSYALAGAVSATFVLTYALLSPQVSRWVDRRGQGRVLPWATAASAAGLLLLLALLAAPDWTLFVAAMLAGCMPSVSAMVRARWTATHRGRPQLQTAYSLETVFDEVTFIAGPPLSVGLSVAVWPGWRTGGRPAAGGRRRRTGAAAGHRAADTALRRCNILALAAAAPEIRLLALLMLAMGVIVGTVDITSVALAELRGQPLAASWVLSATRWAAARRGCCLVP